MLDGEWRFVPNSENTTCPFLGKFDHKSGRMFVSIVCKHVQNYGNIMHIDAELYDGAFREMTARFQLRFVQDFKNYADDFLNMENGYSNVDINIYIYQYFNQLSSMKYYVKSNFSKYFVDDKSIIQIIGNQKGFNGKIIIDLNPIYLGSISSLDINFQVALTLFTSIMSIVMINIDLPETNTDDVVSVCLSSTTLLIVICWFAFLGTESFYLSIICEEYKWFCLSGLAYFLLIVRLVFIFRQMDSLIKYDQISRNKTFISFIFLILMILVLIKANLIFDQRVLILFCGFIWVPQIVHNASNGFTQSDSSFVYLISCCVLYFPLSTQLFKNNIFEFKPSTNCVKYLILLYIIQILILRLQHKLGCRFFIPRSLWKFVFKPNDFCVCDMNESNSECVICLNSNQNISSKSKLDKLFVHLKCGHAFHYNCLRECVKYLNKCPLCRQKIFKSQSEFHEFNSLYLEYQF